MQQVRHAPEELERAKDLVRKLNAKANAAGVTEEEALSFAAKVGELLQRFDISLSELSISEERCVKREVYAADTAAQPMITGIGRLCNLRTYAVWGSSPQTFVLFGMERDVELAIFLYEVCHEAVDVEWAKWIQEGHGHTRKQRESFRAGFGSRVYSRLSELKARRDTEREARMAAQPGCRDLVLVRDAVVDEEFAKTGVRLTTRKTTIADGKAYRHGHDAGGRVNLNSPLEHTKFAGELEG